MTPKKMAAQYDLTPEQLARFLAAMIKIRQPVMVWGPPAIGKSYVAHQVATSLGMHYLDPSAASMEPVDARGVPYVTGMDEPETAMTRWAAPDFLPPANSDDAWLINFDDLTSAVPATHAALYQLIQFGRIGNYTIPKKASIIATGNRESDRGVAYRMGSALRSRFVHAYVKVHKPSWTDFAVKAGFAPQVIFFIEHDPDLLYTFDPKRFDENDQAFASPRTWEFVSNIIIEGNYDPDTLPYILKGAIGEGPAIKFNAFLQMWGQLPHPQTIFDDPDGAPVPTNPSVLMALCGSLYQHVDDTNIDSLVTYAKRLRPELGQFIFASATKRDPSLQFTRAWGAWQAHRKAA